MLGNRRGPISTVESRGQKLFNCIVSNYLNGEPIGAEDTVEPFPISEDLLQYANTLHANVLMGTNYITYKPSSVFSESDLLKLDDLKAQLTRLRTEIAAKKHETGLSTDTQITAAHKTYMDRLHRYNEAKDTAQALLGKLAHLTGTTTRDLYPNFNLSLED